ncbi:MAG: hypothetical protein HKN90_08855 [Flavobacteriaceae bacterium]|nr:hypothetical protein [Flavobacteriaceae bacterium]
MKKLPLLVFILLVSFSAMSQSKIKGNRVVTNEEQSLDYFTKLEVNDKIKLILKQGNQNSLEVEADENLHEVLDADVKNSVLTLSLNKRITRSKRFSITLNVEDLDQIVLNDDCEVTAPEELDVFNLDVILNNKSDLVLDNLKTQFLSLETNERSKSQLRVRTDSLEINAKESSRLKLDIITQGSSVNYSGSSLVEIEGKTSNLTLYATDNAGFKGAEFVAENVLVSALDKSDSYVNAKETIVIEAKNKAKVYVFNKPEINLKIFEDNASLFKRESMTLLENL